MDTLIIPRQRWKKKKPLTGSSAVLIIILCSLLFLFYRYPHAIFIAGKASVSKFPQCNTSTNRQEFLFYAPHSGFSNQLSEFKNAILMAAILNRTLIVPPIIDHHAIALGSCPKFRVLSPSDLRILVWSHAIELIRRVRYVSMADVIDLSPVLSLYGIPTIDFRDFINLWCAVDTECICYNRSKSHISSWKMLEQCGSFLSGIEGNIDNCIYAVQDDCRTTVWIYNRDDHDGVLDTFQPDSQLKKKRKFTHVRVRRDVQKSLGSGTVAGSAKVIAFGSLFTAPYKGSELYIDIPEARTDERVQSVIENTQYLPFTPEIREAGKEFVVKKIKSPFFCAQLRLLDGQFRHHWEATFLELRDNLEYLRRNASLPIHLFVMTDLPEANWTGTYLGDLKKLVNIYRIHVLREDYEVVTRTAKRLVTSSVQRRVELDSWRLGNERNMGCSLQSLPDVSLYIEEIVCSCASLGFFGTSGSTIFHSIQSMRHFGMCSDLKLKEVRIPKN